MKIWKPFERWTEVLGNRIEHLWHADFELSGGEFLFLNTGYTDKPEPTTSHIMEFVPPGKVYRVHLKIALEEFDQE